MSDAAGLPSWKPRYADWRGQALAMMKEGKAKQAFDTYPWYTTEGEPFARLSRPPGETRFALVTTGGYSIEGEQERFDSTPGMFDAEPGVRRIPLDVDRAKLCIDHFGYDHRFAREDINVNLPLDRLREMVEAGEIGSIADPTWVLMGLQPNVEPLFEHTIPMLIDELHGADVEAVLLVPS